MPEGASPAYRDLLVIIRRYVSHIMAESMLDQALAATGRTPETFRPEDAEAVVERAMVGMRLFCVSAELPYLMIALAEYCDRVNKPAQST